MKVLIIDDHPLVRAGLTAVFSTEDCIQVVGEAANVAEAVRLIAQQRPDLALLDLKLGCESGLSVIKQAQNPLQGQGSQACKYIVLTSSTDRADFTRSLAAGVDGYALKQALPEELLYAMRIVAKGRKYFDPLFVEAAPATGGHLPDSLTPKELEVLRALGKGFSNRAIAKELFVTEFTVKKHMSQIFAKLGVDDRTQAALWAMANGFSEYPPAH